MKQFHLAWCCPWAHQAICCGPARGRGRREHRVEGAPELRRRLERPSRIPRHVLRRGGPQRLFQFGVRGPGLYAPTVLVGEEA